MEGNVESAKSEDAAGTATAAAPAPNQIEVVDQPKANEANSEPAAEAKAAVVTVVADTAAASGPAADSGPTAAVVVNENVSTATGEDKLNLAMASTTISTPEADETAQKQPETVSDQLPTQPTAITVPEETVEGSTDADPDASVKLSGADEEANSTIGEFEDAREYVDDDDDRVKEDHIESQQEHSPDGDSCDDDVAEDDEEESKEPEVPTSTVPVPVDDDTNDPQYIPRRGRFYEHDDRMAYSTTSSEGSDSSDCEDDWEEGEEDDRGRRRRAGSKKHQPVAEADAVDDNSTAPVDGTPSTKKVLAISKAAAANRDSSETPITSAGGITPKPGSRKSRDLDSLDKWTHDMYDEHEQAPKSKDELLASYGYDIREESEAPRARRHHKYGRAATTKYTRNWQDTKAYSGPNNGPQSTKVKRGGIGPRNSSGLNKNKTKSGTSDEYNSDFPALDNTKPSESSTIEDNSEQKPKSPSINQETKTVVAATTTSPSKHQGSLSRSSPKFKSPTNRNFNQDQQNGSFSSPSHQKNYFNRPSTDSHLETEKDSHVNRDSPSSNSNPNYYNRRPQHHSGGHNVNNYKQQPHSNNYQGHNQHNQNFSSPAPRNRNFHQNHNQHQYNRDRYFSKGSAPLSNTNQQHFDHSQHNSAGPVTAGTGRTQHSGGHYHHQYNDRQFENNHQRIEQPLTPAPPVVRSSKRYSVQSRRELPDPVLNFGGMSKTPQSQPQQPPVQQHQQQNGLVMQEQPQATMQQIQPQQQPMQIHQQQPMQIQQYHQPLQQMHPHHGMVLDHNTGMMVMATADPSMYHHQLYAAPQYTTAVTPGSATGDDPNAAAAAAALQMLAQAAVYQPVPTRPAGVTPPPSSTQSESYMTTYYQPLQQPPQQPPPPRRVNLAIPIVAPPPEPTQQQSVVKTSSSPTPTAASTN